MIQLQGGSSTNPRLSQLRELPEETTFIASFAAIPVNGSLKVAISAKACLSTDTRSARPAERLIH
jgi:hypothetical protein